MSFSVNQVKVTVKQLWQCKQICFEKKNDVKIYVKMMKILPQIRDVLKNGQPACLSELFHPYTCSSNTGRSSPNLKFLHILTFDRRVYKPNSFRILSFTIMSVFFGNLSPLK